VPYICTKIEVNEFFLNLFWRYFKDDELLLSKWRKGELRILRYEGLIVALVIDCPNRRVLDFYFHSEKKIIHRIAYHKYFFKSLARKIKKDVKKIQDIYDEYTPDRVFKKRSYSFLRERAFNRYVYGKRVGESGKK
jgi:hypothetical protein